MKGWLEPAPLNLQCQRQIEGLCDWQRHLLYERAGDGSGLSDAERDRLRGINVELDRCYDLLHQRQGRRDAGQDPSGAATRSARTVEGYEQ